MQRVLQGVAAIRQARRTGPNAKRLELAGALMSDQGCAGVAFVHGSG